ncbi:MAG TPA: hypothetical protein DEP53_02900 [Bacteroidetes bacterium]|nr:hypothetical protein [Bacteroidota bacterium]
MEKIKKQIPFLIVLIASAFVILTLFPRSHPLGGLRLPLDAAEIEVRSREFLSSLGVATEGAAAQAQLHYDESLLRQIMELNGIEKANEMVSRGIPVHYWNVGWKSSSMFRISSSDTRDASKQAEQVSEILRGTIFTRLGPEGKIIEYDRKVADSVALPSLSEAEAKSLALSFMRRYAAAAAYLPDTVAPAASKRIEQKNRSDYEFIWNTKSPELDNPVKITMLVVGNEIARYEEEITVPEKFKRSDVEKVSQIVLPIVYSCIVLIMIVVAFRRFRSFELGFRLATFVALVSSAVLAVQIYLSYRSDPGWEILIPLILGPLFYGGGLVLVWAVGESVARETWKEKLIPFDLLSKGYGFHSRVGEAAVRGVSIGAAAFAASLLLAYVAGKFTITWVSMAGGESVNQVFGSFATWLYVLGHGVSANAYKLSLVILFSLSFLRKWILSPVLLIVAGALVIALTSQDHISPLWLGILIQAIVSGVIVWSFYRYDALVTFLSLYTLTVLDEAGPMIVSGHQTYVISGYIVASVLGLLVLAGLAVLTKKKELTDFDDIMPAFARHITERQRLQQELEIARSVQMSFLPKANPSIVELDIASRCAPALEVGGDYYDFLNLKDKRLGVVVGDVSGKGTQAAFFMTLTKGFVHALAEVSNSPSAVLTQVNKLFYENVDRGVFISMVYGIFDTAKSQLTLARAGHNPVIMRKTKADQVQVVNPMGLALGLDPGETFSKSIQEVSIPFQSGDLFVFYTDGFPEAMNKTMEEFGEERLCQTVQKYAHGSAAEIMDGVFAEMRQFVGKAKQHDDMTIVVVKIV